MEIGGINLVVLVASLMVAAVPILLAALGELVVEKAGVLNLGVEGMMIMGAICGFIVAVGTGSPVIVPYQTFDTADLPLCLAPGNDRLWARCAVALGRPDWATDPKFAKSAQRVANKTDLLPMIAAALKQKPRAYWLEAMDKAGVPCAPVNDIGEVATCEQMAASKLVQQLPNGDPKVVGLPIAFNRVRPVSARSSPKLGEHTDEVLGRRTR